MVLAGRRGLVVAVIAHVSSAACSTVPGECDPDAARRVVHSEGEGYPAFAGQGLLVSSCGYATFCHAENATGALRRGAPFGLDFDVEPASYDGSPGDVPRLEAAQQRVFERRDAIWSEVASGDMPPGAEGYGVLESPIRPRYAAYDIDPDGERLPELGSAEGRELLRNWLACDVPVIERVVERTDGAPSTVGSVAGASCEELRDCRLTTRARCDLATGTCRPCAADVDCAHLTGNPVCAGGRCAPVVEPTWASIHDVIVARNCAVVDCHGEPGPDSETDLDLGGGREAAYARLSHVSESEACGSLGMPLVTPGDPSVSLLYRKLFLAEGSDEDAVCGARMPYGQPLPLPDPWLDAIASWITSGALGP